MTPQNENSLATAQQYIFRAAIIIVVAANSLMLAGWMLEARVLKTMAATGAVVKPNAALAFVLAGLTLWFSHTRFPTGGKQRIARCGALAVCLIGSLTLAQHIFGWNLGIDELLAGESASGLRMAPSTALNFIFLGIAFLLSRMKDFAGEWVAEILTLIAAAISFIVLVGYLYDMPFLYGLEAYARMTLPTAILFMILCAAALSSYPDGALSALVEKFRFSLATQLIALVVFAVLIVGGAVSVALIRQSQNTLRQQIFANNTADADLLAQFAWRYTEAAELSLEFLAKSSPVVQAVVSGNFNRVGADLEEFLKSNKRMDACSLYDMKGVNRATGNPPQFNTVGSYSGDREWFQQTVLTRRPYLGLAAISRATKRPAVPYGVPVRDQKGVMRGVLVGGISLDALADAITNFQTGAGTRAALADQRQGGIILAHADHRRILKPVSGKNEATRRLLSGERGAIETTSSSGEIDLASFAPVPNLPWGVLILQPLQSVFAPVAVSARQSLLLIVLIFLFTALGAGSLALWITRPLSILRQAAANLAAGNLAHRLNFTRQDELGHLGRTFDHMAAALTERSTELKAANQYLREQNHIIQEANRLKSEFLANMSHELRTPLNGIIGFAQLMHDGKTGPVSDNHKEYLADVLNSARHLLELINDVLDLSKIEAGRLEFSPEPVDVAKVITEVRDILQPLAASKRLAVGVEISPAAAQATIDPARLKQVLYNYLSNAIKFTDDEGRITIRALPEDADYFRLAVEDTGVGIEAEQIAKLFVEFQQLDGGSAKKHQGTGLGLALTKRIVEAQGGRVGVQSVHGRGSTFYAILPRNSLQPALQEEKALPAVAASALLLIDDNEKDLKWFFKTLSEAGYVVETATTGAAGLAKAREKVYDAILLDLILPDMAGWDVLRAIRAAGPNRRAPVITVSVVSEKDAAKGFPIQDFLVKPVHPGMLLESLQRSGVRPNPLPPEQRHL